MIARRLACAGLAARALAAPTGASEQEFRLTIVHGALPAAQRVLRVHAGDQVLLNWRSDRPITVHLHGYDLEWRVRPGSVAQSRFTAYASGRFPIEVHGGDDGRNAAPLAVLEVYPN